MRLVLDTNVIVSGMLWGGPPGLLIKAGCEGAVRLFTSVPMLAELTKVLERAKFRQRILDSGEDVERLIDGYAALCAIVRPADATGRAPDPDDDKVAGTAIAARADLLVTGDRPFLGVADIDGIRIATVRDALELLGRG